MDLGARRERYPQIDGEWPLTVASGREVAALRAGVLVVRIFDLRQLGAAI